MAIVYAVANAKGDDHRHQSRRGAVDLIPANKRLSGVATRLAIEGIAAPADGAGAPERALRAITDALSARYDFIIIDIWCSTM